MSSSKRPAEPTITPLTGASSSSILTTLTTRVKANPDPIPAKIHFIWIGGPMPENYFQTIQRLAIIAKHSDFEMMLWVDNPENYYKTIEKLSIESSATKITNLHLRNIVELKPAMEKESFYQYENRLKKFWDCVDRERVGFRNLAAASDILRYEILRQEGGYYFDTDTEFELDFSSTFELRLITDKPALGIKANLNLRCRINYCEVYFMANPETKVYQSTEFNQLYLYKNDSNYFYFTQNGESLVKHILITDDTQLSKEQKEMLSSASFVTIETKYSDRNQIRELNELILKITSARNHTSPSEGEMHINSMATNNDIIAALPNHIVMYEMINRVIKNYAKLDKEKSSEYSDYKHPFQNKKNISVMDIKRFPMSEKKRVLRTARAQLTIEMTGPNLLTNALKQLWKNELNHSRYVGHSLGIEQEGIAGMHIKSKETDMTWLKKSEGNSKRAFDDASLGNMIFESRKSPKDEKKETKEDSVLKKGKLSR